MTIATIKPNMRGPSRPSPVACAERTAGATVPALMAREDFRAWLATSCERQNLPVVINDLATLTKVAALLQ